MKKKFHRSFQDAIIIFVIGLIVFAVTIFKGNKIVSFHYYLILVFLLSLYVSFQKYAIVNKDGLTLYYGPAYFRKSIFLSWSDILRIKIDSAEKSWMQSYGGRVWLPMKTTINIPALKVILKKNLPFDKQENLKAAIDKYLFPPDEGINDQGNEIILKMAPWGGFKRFFDQALSFSDNAYGIEKS